MQVGRTFSDSIAILRKNIAAMIVGGVVTVVAYLACTFVPVAILGGSPDYSGGSGWQTQSSPWASVLSTALSVLVFFPLLAGLTAIAMEYATTGREQEVGAAFAGFRRYGSLVAFQVIKIIAYIVAGIVAMVVAFFAGIVLSIIPGGFLLLLPVLMAPFVYIEVNWLYVVPVLFDKQCGVMEALGESRRQVRRNGFWPTLVVALVVGLAALGAMLVTLGLGSIIVLPWLAAAIVAMYMQASDRTQLLDAVLAGQPAVQAGQQVPWIPGTVMPPPGTAMPAGPYGAAPAPGMGMPGGPYAPPPSAGPPVTQTPGWETTPGEPPRPAPAQSWDQMPGAAPRPTPARGWDQMPEGGVSTRIPGTADGVEAARAADGATAAGSVDGVEATASAAGATASRPEDEFSAPVGPVPQAESTPLTPPTPPTAPPPPTPAPPASAPPDQA